MPAIQEQTACIDINTATAKELVALPGIGESGASLIVTFRFNAPFKSITDIQNVKRENGRRVVGDKTFEKIQKMICVEK